MYLNNRIRAQFFCLSFTILTTNADTLSDSSHAIFRPTWLSEENAVVYHLDRGSEAVRFKRDRVKHYRHPSCSALFTAQQPIAGSVGRISYRTVHQNWRRLIAEIPELEGVRLHDLRHTFATERVGLMGIEELRALMGHESIMTTLRYQKVTSARAETVAQSALQAIANKADKL